MKTYTIGELINFINETNSSDKPYPFYGININKEFMPSVANTDNVDRKKYLVVRRKRFVFSGMQTGRDNCIRIAMYDKDEAILVSPAYETFEVKENLVLPEYLFMYFRSTEKDRMGAFFSDGSVRANLDIPVFCGIEINLPSIDIQKKYVSVYKAMQKNFDIYQAKVDDLKLVCDGFIEKLRREIPNKEIGQFIKNVDKRNIDNKIKNIKGISVYKEFREPTSKVDKTKLHNYKIIEPGQIGYVQTTHNEKVFAFALNNTDEKILTSSVNEVFECNKNILLPEYLSLFFMRKEFDRYARYYSWGSAREIFPWEDLCSVRIPIPNIDLQESIIKIFNAYKKRKTIAEKMKTQINSICPVLIKGALKEGE